MLEIVSGLHIIEERSAPSQKPAATIPESLLEMHILGLHPRPGEPLSLGPRNLCFNKLSEWYRTKRKYLP